nr:Blp family class II bacteriocin [uncultured Cellulosilyticum sp.]
MELNQFEVIDNEVLEQVDGGGILTAAATVAAVGGALYVVYQCGEAVGKFAYNIRH